jgi:putative pyoverdin transport system ATP-binding/permease protein
MRVINFLVNISGKSYRSLLLLMLWPLISGGCNFLFIVLINRIINYFLNGDLATHRLQYLFYIIGAMVTFAISRSLFSWGIIDFSQKVFWNLRKSIVNMVLRSGFMQIKQMQDQIHSTLVRDINALTNASLVVIEMMIALVIVSGCLVYMFIISPTLFLVSIITIGIGVTLYLVKGGKYVVMFRKSREKEQLFIRYFNAVLGGIKEIDTEYNKGYDIYTNRIVEVADSASSHSKKALTGYMRNQILGVIFFYCLVTAILLYFSFQMQVEKTVIVNFVFILLYILGPVELFMANIPIVNQAIIATNKLIDLKAALEKDNRSSKEVYFGKSRFEQVKQIKVQGMSYHFSGDQDAFAIGPINFTLNAGDIVFLYGGNGAGKTTFLYTLIHLHTPSSGDFFVDGEQVGPTDSLHYKRLFAPVYSDFYLFEELFGIGPVDEVLLRDYLHLFEIEKKVSFQDGKFSTISLSTGQRKRLALIAALLEGKRFLVLDEWAADQDPVFRRKFYKEILPLLQQRGFTILAITHDDQYFNLANKLYKMDNGKLILQGSYEMTAI